MHLMWDVRDRVRERNLRMAARVLAWTMGRMEFPFTGTMKVVGETGQRASIRRGDWNRVKRESKRCCRGAGWVLSLELRAESRLATSGWGTQRNHLESQPRRKADGENQRTRD